MPFNLDDVSSSDSEEDQYKKLPEKAPQENETTQVL